MLLGLGPVLSCRLPDRDGQEKPRHRPEIAPQAGREARRVGASAGRNLVSGRRAACLGSDVDVGLFLDAGEDSPEDCLVQDVGIGTLQFEGRENREEEIARKTCPRIK